LLVETLAAPAETQLAARTETAPVIFDLEEALKESGLQLVETRADVKAQPQEETRFVPAKRARRPAPASLSEPMVQVETRSEPERSA
jgi:hypothetical protein